MRCLDRTACGYLDRMRAWSRARFTRGIACARDDTGGGPPPRRGSINSIYPPYNTPHILKKPRYQTAINTGQRVHRPKRGAGSYDRNQQSLKRVLDTAHDPAPRITKNTHDFCETQIPNVR